MKSSLAFYRVNISTNYEKTMLKFVVLSIALLRSGTIFPVVREITRIGQYKKV
jgi:hypothetical protein